MMNTRGIAVLGFLIVLLSSILPWSWGGGVKLSMLSFYWGVIFAILSGLGLFGASAFTISNWAAFAQLIALIAYPIGIYFAYVSISRHSPSIYQGLSGLSGVLMIVSVFTTIPSFNQTEGAYVAIIGGILLELAYFLSRTSRRYHRR